MDHYTQFIRALQNAQSVANTTFVLISPVTLIAAPVLHSYRDLIASHTGCPVLIIETPLIEPDQMGRIMPDTETEVTMIRVSRP